MTCIRIFKEKGENRIKRGEREWRGARIQLKVSSACQKEERECARFRRAARRGEEGHQPQEWAQRLAQERLVQVQWQVSIETQAPPYLSLLSLSPRVQGSGLV